MRLINTRTLRLENFSKATQTPPYAILSHTWGHGEVSLQQFQNSKIRSRRKGFGKIKSACVEAHRQGLQYIWVDTCCIDKTSSAELSEAINSMFKWYQRSQICYAFCEDVQQESISSPDMAGTFDAPKTEFAASSWFTRGWTLQELIAPKEVIFYNKAWASIGKKSTSSELITQITGIDTFILEGGPLPEVSIGRRMSWAVNRETSREEDIAYSLMGLFDINMPLIYGEGQKAFIRLQEEILRQSDDHTLFAWRSTPESTIRGTASGLLADHPRNFRNFRSQKDDDPTSTHTAGTGDKDHILRVWDHNAPHNPITITNKGIRITSHVVDLHATWNPKQYMILILNCSPGGDVERATGIYVRRQYEDRYARVRTDELAEVRLGKLGDHARDTLHGLKAGGVDIRGHQSDQPWTTSLSIRQECLASQGVEGQHSDVTSGLSLRRRYQDALQLHCSSFRMSNVFGTYILYGMGIWQQHGAWRFFRFDPHSGSKDAIFDTSPGREFALLFRTPNSLDLLIVILGVDLVNGKLWVNAVCVDDEDLTRYGANVAKILKDIRRLSQDRASFSNQKLVLVSGKYLYIVVRIQPRLVEGIPMHRVQLTRPWPFSWTRVMKRGMFVTVSLIVGLIPTSLCVMYMSV